MSRAEALAAVGVLLIAEALDWCEEHEVDADTIAEQFKIEEA